MNNDYYSTPDYADLDDFAAYDADPSVKDTWDYRAPDLLRTLLNRDATIDARTDALREIRHMALLADRHGPIRELDDTDHLFALTQQAKADLLSVVEIAATAMLDAEPRMTIAEAVDALRFVGRLEEYVRALD